MHDNTVTIVCWNMAHKHESWRYLLDTNVDLALLHEVCRPPEDCAKMVKVDPAPWSPVEQRRRIKWRTAIAALSDRVTVEWVSTTSLGQAGPGGPAASSPGTLTTAGVIPRSGEPFMMASLYAELEKPFNHAGSLIYSDASSHRLVSDLAALVSRQHGHRIVAAGDLNLMYGYSADGSLDWTGRYRTVFDRLEAIGLVFGRTTVRRRQKSQSVAGGIAKGQQECPNLAHDRAIIRHGRPPARLCLRLAGPCCHSLSPQ